MKLGTIDNYLNTAVARTTRSSIIRLNGPGVGKPSDGDGTLIKLGILGKKVRHRSGAGSGEIPVGIKSLAERHWNIVSVTFDTDLTLGRR